MPRPRFLTTAQLAADLAMSESGIRGLAQRGRLPGAVKIGSEWRFKAEDVERWLSPAARPVKTARPLAAITRSRAVELTEEERRYFGITRLDTGTGSRHNKTKRAG